MRLILASLLVSYPLSLLAADEAALPLHVSLCPAAVVVAAPLYRESFYGANGQPQQLVVTNDDAMLPGCESTRLALPAANSVAWAALVPADRLDGPVNYFALQGNFSPAINVSEIVDTYEPPAPTVAQQPPAPPHREIREAVADPVATMPPRQQAVPTVTPDVNKAPAVTSPPETVRTPRGQNATRSAWLWSPALWLQRPELIWQLQAQHQLREVYLTVPVNETEGVENVAQLSAFIAEASRRQLRVWAVIGDRQDVLSVSRAALQRRLEGYRHYNDSVAAESRLAGAQLDIEPYLLPGFSLAQDNWRERYIDVIGFAHSLLNPQLQLDLVVPGWWGTHPDWSNLLLDTLAVPGLSLTVMNYQTDADSLRRVALPFLAWGQRTGVPVRMALETGRLGDQQRRYYGASAARGELWLINVAEQPVLVLFATPTTGLDGKVFIFSDETTVPGSNSTFAGDLQRLGAVLAEMEPEWKQWPGFAGVAIHGLEESLDASTRNP